MPRREIDGFLFALLLLAGACSKSGNKSVVQPPPPPPAAAGGLYCSQATPSRIFLRWRDNSDNELGFRIQRRHADSSFVALGDTVAANHTSTSDAYRIQNGERYAYRIVAYRAGAEATPSNEISVLAGADHAPSAPADIQPPNGATDIDPGQPVVLSWSFQDLDGDPLTYDIYYGATLQAMGMVSVGQEANTFTLNGPFVRNSHYFWKVVAHTPKGVSTPSRLLGFNTLVDRDVVPAGNFFLGDTLETLPNGTASPFWNPNNPVDLPEFNIDRYEMTNQQYATFLNQKLERKELRISSGTILDAPEYHVWATIFPYDLDSDITFSVQDSAFIVVAGREQFPVVQVSWYGADSCAWFYGRRLPTEEQWEKAARGTSSLIGSAPGDTVGWGFPYPWGAGSDLNRANVLNSGDPYENQGGVRTTPVDFYRTEGADQEVHGGYTVRPGKSPYGVEDMAGNVWEWTESWYRGPYANPQESPHFKVLRGGSYNLPLGSATTWNRIYEDPEMTDRTYGFRTVSAPNP